MAEYTLPQTIPRTRAITRAVAIPLWEKGFAILGLFLCLDAGVRTLRILSGAEGPIQSIASPEVDYSQGSTLTQVLLFAVYLVSIMLLLINPTQQLTRAFKAKLIWLLPALALVSVLWSSAPSISFRRAAALLGSSIFGLYLGTRYPRRELMRFLLAVSVLVTILSLLTVIALPTYAIDDSGAWQGVFGQKNALGQFMALSAVVWLLYAASVRRQRLLAGFGVLSVALVLLSHSATGIALLVILAAAVLLSRIVRLRASVALPLLLSLLAVGGYLAMSVVRDFSRVAGLFGRDPSLTGRTQLWSLVWQMIRTHPWLGFGYGGFWLGFDGPSASIWSTVGWNPPTAHNGFLDLLLDLGIAGMILFVPTMLVAIRYAVALARRGRTLDTAFPLTFLVFYLASNITESSLVAYNSLSWVLFFALTIHLHLWWQEERRLRAHAGGRALAAPNHDIPPARSVRAAVAKDRSTFQEGCRMGVQVTVSAIMPTYNAMPYLKEAIDSVLAQTFTDWELIIVDDGSTDETSALLAQYTDPRIRVFELDGNHGPAHARNIALGFACGKYIAPCDSDDIFLPERFAKEVAYLESHPEVHVVATQMKYFRQNERPQPHILYPEEPTAIQRRFARGRMAVPFGASMIRSWCFDRFGPFREDLRSAEDLEWFLRIRRSCNFRVLPEFLYLYRQDATKASFRKWRVDMRNERYAVYRATMFGTSSDSAVLSFTSFSRRWQTRLGLSTWDVLRFVNSRLRSQIVGRKLK